MEPQTLSARKWEGAAALVADDNAPIRDICARVLRNMGFEVETASSADEALPKCLAREFDLVLTDISMPGKMDGAGLVAAVKQRRPATDLIVMTGFPDLQNAVQTLKSGAFDYLVKPMAPEVIESVAGRCMEKRRLAEELGREKIMRAEIEAAYGELRKVERLKESILARVHHELRTPLTTALAAAELLLGEPLGAAGRELAEKALRGVRALRDRIEELLLFADLQRSGLEPVRTEVCLGRLVAKIAADLRPAWEEKKLSVELPPAEPSPPLRLDLGLAETALKNLFLNAVKFTPPGGRVAVGIKYADGGAEVAFTDTGPGIPEEDLPKLTDSFYQAAEFLTREAGGLGLGLAIVRRIAEAHGGSVSVRSREGAGSTFTIAFPG